MRKMLCATALVTVALLGAGCKKGPDLVGKWTGSAASAPAGAGALDVEFKPDNTFTMGAKLGQSTMSFSGDYKLDGEKLTLTMKDLQFSGMPPAMLAKAKQSPEFSKPKDTTIKFTDADDATLTGFAAGPAGAGAGQTLNLKRVKS